MEHGYELKYKNGVGGELIYKFSDDIDIHSLKDNLEYFLLIIVRLSAFIFSAPIFSINYIPVKFYLQ